MPVRQTSRELAARVNQQFHRAGRPFRRWVNWLSVAAGLLVVGVLVVLAGRGRNVIYHAGPVAGPHRMFENDCAMCHETWGPAARLVSFSDVATTAPNAKCRACHEGVPHYKRQIPAHDGMSCAACHREHRGGRTLIPADDQMCTSCHENLQAHLADGVDATPFVNTITHFITGHPEFEILRAEEPKDDATIMFNHAAHLVHEYDSSGTLIKGVLNERGELEDLARDCTPCHLPDIERGRMQPIHYESHCARCHPLLFDPGGATADVVPHEPPEVVLGFLRQRAAAAVLNDEAISSPGEGDLRRLPGVQYQPPLSTDQADEAERRVREAERVVQQHTHRLFGEEAKGGCKFCHEIDSCSAAADGDATSLAAWRIAPTEIRENWLPHAKFSHDSHRFLDCRECHHGVMESTQTSDLLLPNIDDCRKCHGRSKQEGQPVFQPVRSQCIDCHSYHDRSGESLAGALTTELKPREGQTQAGN